ncbi:MAG: hypothetical protein F4169_16890 [Gammaproteobacteria bacterium]|nr:hypothetical protein [Gammaproteobacteria bacterium]
MPVRWTFEELQPAHVAAGLGAADREFLSVCLGIFDDAALMNQLKLAAKKGIKFAKAGGIPLPDLDTEVRHAADRWRDQQLTCNHLRAVLWIRLQSAFAIDPNATRSVRGCERLADDLVAAALRVPPDGLSKKVRRGISTSFRCAREKLQGNSSSSRDLPENDEVPTTLGTLAAPLLVEMVGNALGEKSKMPQEDRDRFVAETAARLSEDERQVFLGELSGPDFDRALRNWIAAGGVYGAVGGAVAVSGFAPYILAAQASAFVPFVSGPALVSLLSVLTNPLIILAVVGGFGYHWAQSANKQAAAKVALHVISLLACDGIGRSRVSLEELVASFAKIPDLPEDVFGSPRERRSCLARWRELDSVSQPAPRSKRPVVADDWESTGVNRASVGVAAVSVGDLLYSLAAIDPDVVAAADFSSSGEIEDSFDFAVNLLAQMDDQWRGRESLDGLVESQKGYLMEQLAATELAADGHVVEIPDTANQPGWDLIVDGQPFQVKCLADSRGLADHFENYPDIPVLANSDLIGDYENWAADWQDNVFFLEGHTNELLARVTERSYLEAKDLADNDVPEIALAYVAARQVWKLKTGEVTASQAASHLLIEGSARVGLAVTGGVVGTSIGLLVLGPAGALVAGALAPIIAQAGAGRLAAWLREVGGLQSETYREIESKSNALLLTVQNAINEKLAVLRVKYRRAGNGVAGRYVRHRIADEGRHLHECKSEVVRLRDNEKGKLDSAVSIIRVALRSVHPSRYQAQLRDLLDVLQVNGHAGARSKWTATGEGRPPRRFNP